MNELLRLAWSDFLSLFLIFVRIGTVFAVVPFFSAEIIPRRITTLIALFLSFILMPVVPQTQIRPDDLNILMLMVILVNQMLVGLTLGLAIDVIFSGIQIAGELMGFQMGFSIANVVDPMTGATAPITSNLLYITAFLLFFSFGGHHLLIKALVETFTVIPIGDRMVHTGFLMSVISYAGQMFIIGVKVAAPVVGVLLLINVSFAIIARALPQMNVFLMAFPLTIAVGLIFVALVIRIMPIFMVGSLENAWAFMKTAMALY
ncbi:MAG TPA: flagellar biosynthetic protein FliR [Deltaproteobacteria bacterium]|nr:flagellar biosynthetic protein FliR [Deltaproteobacteria bacterium]HPR54636.1 flagellar biosynthetic protein FliR [Deltaproteobacteria bacterium]HXK47232.1 flagellar biosynthetic protein FliR [Deltaproteobacteria bacterium]